LKAEEEVLRQQLQQVEREQKQIISDIQKEKDTTKKFEDEEER
jgi:hypothetical protein